MNHLQTFLTAAEVDRLVDDYLDGTTVNELADRYCVHRATVSAHLTRRRVGRRRPGLGAEEAAEAVRLHLGGVSMRAIAQSMGVDRKAVRRALVESSAIGEPACATTGHSLGEEAGWLRLSRLPDSLDT